MYLHTKAVKCQQGFSRIRNYFKPLDYAPPDESDGDRMALVPTALLREREGVVAGSPSQAHEESWKCVSKSQTSLSNLFLEATRGGCSPEIVLGIPGSFSRFAPKSPRLGTRPRWENKTTTMKLIALLTIAVSLVLVGCEKSEPTPAAPSTNAPAK